MSGNAGQQLPSVGEACLGTGGDVCIKLPVALLDYEASSLSDRSYPIEAGWAIIAADLSISSGGMLIRPHHRWTDWSEKAQLIHGITREMLFEGGAACREVAEHLAGIFDTLHGGVLSPDPAYETFWSDRLHEAAGVQRLWTIGSFHAALATTLKNADGGDVAEAKRALTSRRPHRAEADAKLFASVLAAAIRQQLRR